MKYISAIIITILLISYSMINIIKSKLLYFPTQDHIWFPNISTDLNQTGGHQNQNYVNEIYVGRVHVWYFPYDTNAKTILISHGNGGNISNRKWLIKTLQEFKVNVCIYDYQGYGKSQGKPSETQFYQDGDAVYNHLVTELKIKPENLIMLGESIGGGVASYLAHKHDVPKLILLSSFTSIKNMYQHMLPSFLAFLKILCPLITEFPTNERLKTYQGQTLILHSQKDTLIPYEQALQNAENPRCQLVEITGTHNNPQLGSLVIQQIQDFIIN